MSDSEINVLIKHIDSFHLSVEKNLQDIWHAINSLRENVSANEVRQTEKIASLQANVAHNKWLIGIFVGQVLGWVVWLIKNI